MRLLVETAFLIIVIRFARSFLAYNVGYWKTFNDLDMLETSKSAPSSMKSVVHVAKQSPLRITSSPVSVL
jgi:hypothetical protein